MQIESGRGYTFKNLVKQKKRSMVMYDFAKKVCVCGGGEGRRRRFRRLWNVIRLNELGMCNYISSGSLFYIFSSIFVFNLSKCNVNFTVCNKQDIVCWAVSILNKHDLERITSVVLYLEIDKIEMHGQLFTPLDSC